MPFDNPLRCQASMSADWYRRKARKEDTYDHARWLWMDGGHERCPRGGVVVKAGASTGVYLLCRVHASRPVVFPYLQPGATCRQPCCAGDAEVWSVSVWHPSKRLAGPPEGLPSSEEKLRALYQGAADTSLLMLDPEES